MSGIRCGSQSFLCALPIGFDNYSGCSHGCKYCFVQRKYDIADIKSGGGVQQLENFIKGKRSIDTNWCDWNIPIHRGGLSDPLQPIEKEIGTTKKALELFAKTQYPFVISTKGALLGDDEYLDLLSKCNVVVQVSLVSPQYDRLEPGCPKFSERLDIIRKVSPRVKRVIVRCQPYIPQVKQDVLNQIPMYKEAGVYGVVFEGMEFIKKVPGLVKLGGDCVIPRKKLVEDFTQLRDMCHHYGLKFYSGENRLRNMGDDLCCCGIDGLEGFTPNYYNLNYYLYDKEKYKPTEAMKKKGSGQCFRHLTQATVAAHARKEKTFQEGMDIIAKDKGKLDTFLAKD